MIFSNFNVGRDLVRFYRAVVNGKIIRMAVYEFKTLLSKLQRIRVHVDQELIGTLVCVAVRIIGKPAVLIDHGDFIGNIDMVIDIAPDNRVAQRDLTLIAYCGLS